MGVVISTVSPVSTVVFRATQEEPFLLLADLDVDRDGAGEGVAEGVGRPYPEKDFKSAVKRTCEKNYPVSKDRTEWHAATENRNENNNKR